MRLLGGFRVVQIGDGLAAAVCGRLLADVGAEVSRIDPDNSTPLADYLNHGKTTDLAAARCALTTADLIVCEGQPRDLRIRRYDAAGLRHADDAGPVAAHEELLEGCLADLGCVENRLQLALDLEQPEAGTGVGHGPDGAAAHDLARLPEQRVAGRRQAGVDA